MFDHDDDMTDRSVGSRLVTADRQTKQLWYEMYGESIIQSGCMYRGPSPYHKLHSMNLFEVNTSSCACITKWCQVPAI